MRKIPAAWLALGIFFALSALCIAQTVAQTGKVENLGPVTDSSVPEAVRQSLDAKGYRLTLDDSKPLCDLWIRKSVPSQSQKDKDVEGVAYPQLAESVMIGVLHFVQAATDFRGQKIPAGFYTLRYELLPNDGNHLGVAPNRDFLLLIPAASDPDPSATFKYQELVTMSAAATGSKHPAVMSLSQPDHATTAVLSANDQDQWVFAASMKLSSGNDLPFALVVKGTAQQ